MIANSKQKILLLDDDSAFLDVAAYYLESKFANSAIISTFNHSQHFIDHIQNHCYLPERPQDILQFFYSSNKSKTEIEQTLRDLSELPAILIIDHHLRDEATNGIELSKKIKAITPSSFIILLTAEVDAKKAIDLHNNDIIDVFIRKDDVNPMGSTYNHIQKQIDKMNTETHIDPEEALSFETVVEDPHYMTLREELLNTLRYKSYLTLTNEGAIAVLNANDQISHYSYHNKVFSPNG